jgi:CBS domain containing-hemolysin-like protein
MITEIEDPSSINPAEEPSASDAGKNGAQDKAGLMQRLKYLVTGQGKPDGGLREAIEEYIEEPQSINTDSISTHERLLLSNILALRDERVHDVMVPRADIIAIEENTTPEALFALLAERQFSRLPVYRETLDDVLGTIHIKDIMAMLAKKKKVVVKDLITEIPIVSPSLPVLDLMLEMRQSSRHMALVVDEYGGIDGLVTIGDVIENIIGEIDDEHNVDDEPQMIEQEDGTLIADARVGIEEFELRYGNILSDEEREECDTLGGLAFSLAGRVPARGEILAHPSGMVFEVLDADPRKITALKIQQIPIIPREFKDMIKDQAAE